MKFLTLFLLALSTLLGQGVARAQGGAQSTEGTAAAQTAAAQWLALTDANAFAESWDRSAAAFQAAVSRAQWDATLQTVRKPLGKLKSRSVQSAVYKSSLPGAPAGEYVIIQYQSSFENMPSATETVTPMREKDGSWRVSGYFIK